MVNGPRLNIVSQPEQRGRMMNWLTVGLVFVCGILTLSPAQTNYQRLKSFGSEDPSGAFPNELIEATDGRLYGTTEMGGSNDMGTVFVLQTDGSSYKELHSFSRWDGDGRYPNAALVEGIDGALYGTTELGGKNTDGGTVFKLNKDGSGYRVLHSFSRDDADGDNPKNALVEGADGALFGTTLGGGIDAQGTVFRIAKDGSGFTVLHRFTGAGDDGRNPDAALIEGSDGALYGTTPVGGRDDKGTVFKLNKDGSGYAVLLHVPQGDCHGRPDGALLERSDGLLYGISRWRDRGMEFTLRKDGSGYTVVYCGVWQKPSGTLVQGRHKVWYGTTRGGGNNDVGTVFTLNADGEYALIHQFRGDYRYGWGPNSLLISGSGALYGTASGGGTQYGGTVFTLNKDGSGFRVLHSFADYLTGTRPFVLVQGRDGTLYGTTVSGGAGQSGGLVFKLHSDGSGYEVLHDFSGVIGSFSGGLWMDDNAGVLYGTTFNGSDSKSAIFRLNQNGSGYTLLRAFPQGIGDGHSLTTALIGGSDGALYGTTGGGGITNATVPNGGGTVFKLNKDGSGYAVLYRWSGGEDGRSASALVESSEGVLYGATGGGITNQNFNDGAGTVFRLNRDGSGFQVLHRFTGDGDGASPASPLVEGQNGALYGTTQSGGITNRDSRFGMGIVFRLNKDGSGYTVLHRFTGINGDGADPGGMLLTGHDGELYGTTLGGGDTGLGTVFKLFATPPLISIAGIDVGSAGVRLNCSGGAADATYRIQSATTLYPTGNWQVIGSAFARIDGRFDFLDTTPANHPARYYRVAVP